MLYIAFCAFRHSKPKLMNIYIYICMCIFQFFTKNFNVLYLLLRPVHVSLTPCVLYTWVHHSWFNISPFDGQAGCFVCFQIFGFFFFFATTKNAAIKSLKNIFILLVLLFLRNKFPKVRLLAKGYELQTLKFFFNYRWLSILY